MLFLPLRGCLLAGLAGCAPLLALAQVRAEASDPAVPVPPPAYRSAWTATQPRGVADGTTDWPQANAEVGQFPRGHADLVRWEARQAVRPAASPPAGTAPPAAPSPHEHRHGQEGRP